MKNEQLPIRTQSFIFRGKATLLQIKGDVENLLDKDLRRFSLEDLNSQPVLSESIPPLWTEKESEEQFLQAGKIQNLRVAVCRLKGLQTSANQVFSFWKQVGKTSRRKSFVAGRELREGCIIPNIGGRNFAQTTAAFFTLKHLFWATAKQQNEQVILAAQFTEVEISDFASNLIEDNGLQIFGFVNHSSKQVQAFIGLGEESMVQEFRKLLRKTEKND